MNMPSRIQDRVRLFENELLPLKSFVSNTQLPSLIATTETFFDGFRTLGVGELHARQFERESQLKTLSARAKLSQEMFKKYNDIGVQRIQAAMGKLAGVSKELSAAVDPKNLKGLEGKLKAQIDEFKLQAVDMEIKGRDAERLLGAVDEVFSSLQKGGYDSLTGLMDKKMNELITLRKSDNRGAVDNFPVWKVAAIVVALGVWIIALIHCTFFSCSVGAGAAYYIIIAIAAVVAYYC